MVLVFRQCEESWKGELRYLLLAVQVLTQRLLFTSLEALKPWPGASRAVCVGVCVCVCVRALACARMCVWSACATLTKEDLYASKTCRWPNSYSIGSCDWLQSLLGWGQCKEKVGKGEGWRVNLPLWLTL